MDYIVHGVTKSQTRLSDVHFSQDIKLMYRKSVALLYTSNELSEREIKETVPFTIAS